MYPLHSLCRCLCTCRCLHDGLFPIGHGPVWDSDSVTMRENIKISWFHSVTIAALKWIMLKWLGKNRQLCFPRLSQCILFESAVWSIWKIEWTCMISLKKTKIIKILLLYYGPDGFLHFLWCSSYCRNSVMENITGSDQPCKMEIRLKKDPVFWYQPRNWDRMCKKTEPIV